MEVLEQLALEGLDALGAGRGARALALARTACRLPAAMESATLRRLLERLSRRYARAGLRDVWLSGAPAERAPQRLRREPLARLDGEPASAVLFAARSEARTCLELRSGRLVGWSEGGRRQRRDAPPLTPAAGFGLDARSERALVWSGGELRLHDAESGALLRRFPARGALRDVALDDTGRLAAFVGERGGAQLWDVEAGRPLGRIGVETRVYRRVLLLPDNRALLCAAQAESDLEVWDTAHPRLVRRLERHRRPIVSVATDASGRRAATGGKDGDITIWDLERGEPMRVLRGHELAVVDLDMTADGALVVSVSADNTLRFWSPGAPGQPCIHTRATTGRNRFAAVAVSPAGRDVVTATRSGLQRWRTVWHLAERAQGPLTPWLNLFMAAAPGRRRRRVSPWSDAELDRLLGLLSDAGRGSSDDESVRLELERRARAWRG